jgi:hypothetical protein
METWRCLANVSCDHGQLGQQLEAFASSLSSVGISRPQVHPNPPFVNPTTLPKALGEAASPSPNEGLPHTEPCHTTPSEISFNPEAFWPPSLLQPLDVHYLIFTVLPAYGFDPAAVFGIVLDHVLPIDVNPLDHESSLNIDWGSLDLSTATSDIPDTSIAPNGMQGDQACILPLIAEHSEECLRTEAEAEPGASLSEATEAVARTTSSSPRKVLGSSVNRNGREVTPANSPAVTTSFAIFDTAANQVNHVDNTPDLSLASGICEKTGSTSVIQQRESIPTTSLLPTEAAEPSTPSIPPAQKKAVSVRLPARNFGLLTPTSSAEAPCPAPEETTSSTPSKATARSKRVPRGVSTRNSPIRTRSVVAANIASENKSQLHATFPSAVVTRSATSNVYPRGRSHKRQRLDNENDENTTPIDKTSISTCPVHYQSTAPGRKSIMRPRHLSGTNGTRKSISSIKF